jgi:hypothetical protein
VGRLIEPFISLPLQGAVFDPGISFAKSKPFLDRMLDGFFDYGEGKR